MLVQGWMHTVPISTSWSLSVAEYAYNNVTVDANQKKLRKTATCQTPRSFTKTEKTMIFTDWSIYCSCIEILRFWNTMVLKKRCCQTRPGLLGKATPSLQFVPCPTIGVGLDSTSYFIFWFNPRLEKQKNKCVMLVVMGHTHNFGLNLP